MFLCQRAETENRAGEYGAPPDARALLTVATYNMFLKLLNLTQDRVYAGNVQKGVDKFQAKKRLGRRVAWVCVKRGKLEAEGLADKKWEMWTRRGRRC